MSNEEFDTAEEIERLAQVVVRLREKRIELARTIRAVRQKRRTPDQIRSVIDRAKRALYRSILLRRLEQERIVH
jgi:hypothetical protein